MKNILKDYGDFGEVRTLYCDNLSAINISKNSIQHSRTKQIDIGHHYIWNMVEDKIIYLRHISTKDQLADIFTKGLDASRYESLQSSMGGMHYELDGVPTSLR